MQVKYFQSVPSLVCFVNANIANIGMNNKYILPEVVHKSTKINISCYTLKNVFLPQTKWHSLAF